LPGLFIRVLIGFNIKPDHLDPAQIRFYSVLFKLSTDFGRAVFTFGSCAGRRLSSNSNFSMQCPHIPFPAPPTALPERNFSTMGFIHSKLTSSQAPRRSRSSSSSSRASARSTTTRRQKTATMPSPAARATTKTSRRRASNRSRTVKSEGCRRQ
jgi:hypothetical protein